MASTSPLVRLVALPVSRINFDTPAITDSLFFYPASISYSSAWQLQAASLAAVVIVVMVVVVFHQGRP